MKVSGETGAEVGKGTVAVERQMERVRWKEWEGTLGALNVLNS